MKKNYFKFSLTLNVITALIAVAFSLFYYIYVGRLSDGAEALSALSYFKTFFDLIAVFTGYATIIFAFSRYDFHNGLISLGVFSISFLISFFFQVIGACIDNTAEFSVDFLIYVIYYSFGNGFITQMLPALLLAYIAYKTTKDGTRKITSLFSWKNPIQRSMIIMTLIVFGLNFISHTAFFVLPDLIEFEFFITKSLFTDIVVSYIALILFYLVMQYLMYLGMYKLYDRYTETHYE